MKKLFALLLLCAFGSMVMMAQSDVTTSYRFEETDNGKTLTIYGTGDLTQLATNLSAEPNAQACLKEVLLEKVCEKEKKLETEALLSNSFETVRFINEHTDKELIIDNGIIHAILFPKVGSQYYQFVHYNNSIITLDLGATTIKDDFGSETFYSKDGYQPIKSISEITLPLTIKTSFTNDATGDYVTAMSVPSNILANYTSGCNLKTVTIPEGYEWVGKEAFKDNNTIITVNFPTTMNVIGESAFAGCTALTNINLNEGLENIGKDAFNIGIVDEKQVALALTKIKFPSTLRIINDGAFYGWKSLGDLKFNSGLYFIGNSAFGLPSSVTEKYIEIPASVRYIGPGAFFYRRYQDVYFYGKAAPLMPLGKALCGNDSETLITAFSAETLNGYSGFTKGDTEGSDGKPHDMPTKEYMYDNAAKGYANRENYKNGNTYFCIMHYPKGLENDARAEYTDITRAYITGRNADGTFQYGGGAYDVGENGEQLTFGGNTASTRLDWGYEDTYLGGQYIWPSQNQWMRSYIVNSCGYNWDGKTSYASDLSEEDIKTLAYAGYVIGTEDGQYTRDELEKIAHMGTRQFVLANADVNGRERVGIGEVETNPNPDLTMEGENWWTICVPFDMTKKQVDEVFGPSTHVCRFSAVERKDNEGSKSIVLKFQNDVYATKWVRDPNSLQYTKDVNDASPGDDDIVIYSREAYMIYPTKKETIDIIFEDYENGVGDPLATLIKANAGVDGATDQTEYRFVGTYLTEVNSYDADSKTSSTVSVKIPQYSYMYAKKKGDAAYKFWFLTGENMSWKANKCVVQVSDRDARAGEFLDFFGGDGNNSKVDQSSLFGEDNSATAIENVVVIAGEGKDAQVVYSINGQVVRGNGSLDGLGKGVYIRGGKKFVVK